MDFLSRKLKMNNWEEVTYPIMTEQEAKEKKLRYVHWKKAKKGQLALSDDGYVAECLKRGKYKASEEITVPYGRMWINGKARLLYEPHRKTGEYSQVGTRPWGEREASLERTKNAVNLYVNMMLGTGKIDWDTIGRAYRPDQANPSLTVKRLFKQQRISSMVDKKIQEYLDDRELNQGDVLDVIAEAIEMARRNSDPSNMLRASEQYIKIMDMIPSKTHQTDTIQIDVTKKILDQISTEERRQLKLERTEEVSYGEEE